MKEQKKTKRLHQPLSQSLQLLPSWPHLPSRCLSAPILICHLPCRPQAVLFGFVLVLAPARSPQLLFLNFLHSQSIPCLKFEPPWMLLITAAASRCLQPTQDPSLDACSVREQLGVLLAVVSAILSCVMPRPAASHLVVPLLSWALGSLQPLALLISPLRWSESSLLSWLSLLSP